MSKTAETNLFSASKKQFYAAEGTGRDGYIYRDNGGFCPMRGPAMVEGLGMYKVSVLLLSIFILYNAFLCRFFLHYQTAPFQQSGSYSLKASRLCQQWWWSWHLYRRLLWRSEKDVPPCPWKADFLQQLAPVWLEGLWIRPPPKKPHCDYDWKAWYVRKDSKSL